MRVGDETLEKSGLDGMIEVLETEKDKLEMKIFKSRNPIFRDSNQYLIDVVEGKIFELRKVVAWLEARRDKFAGMNEFNASGPSWTEIEGRKKEDTEILEGEGK